MDNDTRKVVAEFIGTFTFVFAVVGSIGLGESLGLLGIALAQGLAMGTMITCLGHISGAHFNPAVTFGAFLTRKIDSATAIAYVIAQLAGAVGAALVARWLYPGILDLEASSPSLSAGTSVFEGLVLEALLTFFLVWVVFATAIDERGAFAAIAGYGIGLIIAVDIMIAGPITGASMNVARAFGPQLVFNEWSDAWLYWLGPLIGGGVAAWLYQYLYLSRREQAEA
jgi:aquaporin TIP